MNKICAIVVTYNRKDILKDCITSILSQSIPVDIMIIDNASTDGTKAALKDWILEKKITYYNMKKNLGGAGGFYYGIKKAVLLSYEYVWIMDDDTIPDNDAAGQLYKAACELDNHFGFLASTVFFNENELCQMNRPGISRQWYSMKKYNYIQKGLINLEYASFVSLLIKSDVIKNVGLPLKEFFIWNDDYEFTTRISKMYDNYLVCNSVVKHKMKENKMADILIDSPDRIARHFYGYRNAFYVAKRDGIKCVVKYILSILELLYKIIFSSISLKGKRCYIVIKGVLAGIIFHPKVEYLD